MPGIAWFKLTDPGRELPDVPSDSDLRVLLPEGEEFDIRASRLADAGAQVRQVRYLLEDEAITGEGKHREVITWPTRLGQPGGGSYAKVTGPAITGAGAAFELMWQDQALPVGQAAMRTPVPVALAAFLPYSTLA